MKKLALAIFAIFICAVAINAEAAVYGEGKREYVGKPEATREAGMVFWRLVNPAGVELELLGAPYEFEEKNKKAAACIENAIENDGQVRISGNWKKDGEAFLLDAETAVCLPVKGKTDCPDKVVETVTLNGRYDGIECGDFCYMYLRLPDNDEFSALADETEVERLFGKKKGVKVSATFELQQMWWSEGGPEDTDPNSPGWCDISPVFKNGKILGK